MRDQVLVVQHPNVDDEMVSVERARVLVGEPGEPCARQTVFVLGATGQVRVRRVAGRYLVDAASIAAYRRR
jgi:hypothetical protein